MPASNCVGLAFLLEHIMAIKTVQALKDEFAETDPLEYNDDLLDTLSAGGAFVGLGHFTVGNNTYTELNKLAVSTRTVIPFESATLNTSNLVSQILSQGTPFSNNKLLVYKSGASGTYRLNFKASSATNNNFFDISLDIGGSQGEIVETTRTFAKGAATTTSFSATDSFFTGSTFVANGGEFYIDPNAEIEVWDISLLVVYTTYPAA